MSSASKWKHTEEPNEWQSCLTVLVKGSRWVKIRALLFTLALHWTIEMNSHFSFFALPPKRNNQPTMSLGHLGVFWCLDELVTVDTSQGRSSLRAGDRFNLAMRIFGHLVSLAETDLAGCGRTDLAGLHDGEPQPRINSLRQPRRDSNSLKPIDNLFRCNEMAGGPHVLHSYP